MSLKDFKNSLMNMVHGGRDKAAENMGMTSSLPTGGFTGYKPKAGRGDVFSTSSINAAQMPPQEAMPQANPGTWQGQPQPSMQMPPVPQNAPQAGYAPAETGGAQFGYAPPQAQAAQPPVQNMPAPQPAPVQPQPNQPPQATVPNNISYMPGTFVGNDGKAYSHVERVVQLVSVQACFRIIEFMRNSESVIVNTEALISDADVQRCLDMLAGAAFTLGCTLTKITQLKRAYLIAPRNVLVMQDAAVARWSEPETVAQQTVPDNMSGYGQPAWQQQVREQMPAQQPMSQTSYVPPVQYAPPQMSWSGLAQQAAAYTGSAPAATAPMDGTFRGSFGQSAMAGGELFR